MTQLEDKNGTNKMMMMRQSNDSLLNEHWKRKQRLKGGERRRRSERRGKSGLRLLVDVIDIRRQGHSKKPDAELRRTLLAENLLSNGPSSWPGGGIISDTRVVDTSQPGERKPTAMIDDTLRWPVSLMAEAAAIATTTRMASDNSTINDRINCHKAGARWWNLNLNLNSKSPNANLLNDVYTRKHSSHCRLEAIHSSAAATDEVTGPNGAEANGSYGNLPDTKRVPTLKRFASAPIINFTSATILQPPLLLLLLQLLQLLPLLLLLVAPFTCAGQSILQSDPRPTIYSGQVSFGLLLSAHSSLGAELSTSASHQVVSLLRVDPPNNHTGATEAMASATMTTTKMTTQLPVMTISSSSSASAAAEHQNATSSATTPVAISTAAGNKGALAAAANGSLADFKQLYQATTAAAAATTTTEPTVSFVLEPQFQLTSHSILKELIEGQESRIDSHWIGAGAGAGDKLHSIERRQIFERTGQHRRQQQQQTHHLSQPASSGQLNNGQAHKSSSVAGHSNNQLANNMEHSSPSGICSLVNANALYAGMGAIWASHQANLVGDSHLAIGTYVYDSCNDLDVGQRQSVRIVSNLNAFQQTTCESPRGSPISLTIAHGDNQLRAIQLLTSFKVPVITTKEHFDLEDYNQLARDQKRFLFTTASSSRHLAVGALRFSKRIVSRSVQSPKLPNQFHKMSSKNGLIVISRNLPARFIAYLTEMIPNHVNYEMLQSNQPIDQIRSVEALESILIKSPTSESKLVLSKTKPPVVAIDGGLLGGLSNKLNNNNKTPRQQQQQHSRKRRNLNDDTDSSSNSDGNSNSDDSDFPGSFEDPDNTKMLSPTILMFITPSEAIDLVTRLRNDLAEVSRYYSLIVTTREDISPALKTIFHRGGSGLCSGKAFYTISPKPDDIGEFSRYFRDTVQMEGETSDHPLVCEFAKYQATSKVTADLDDISTEPVIKAVWSAAAAFKSVHRRECGSLAASNPSEPGSSPTGSAAGATGSSGSGSSSAAPSRTMSSRQSSKSQSAHADCLVKMNKNMSNLVQRALKRLDVTINSTGLQSLDGFRLKFDDLNELMTNKFSIKYINKECEITEIGQYSGLKDSSLRIDEETLVKSLEGSMPDPWPAQQMKPVVQLTQPATSTTNKPTTTEPSTQGSDVSETPGYDSGDNSNQTAASTRKGRRKQGRRGGGGGGSGGEVSSAPEVELTKRQQQQPQEEEDTTSALAGDSSDSSPVDTPRRNRKRSKPGADEKQTSSSSSSSSSASTSSPKRKQHADPAKRKQLVAAPVTALGGRNILPGLTDTEAPSSDPRSARALPVSTTIGGSTAASSAIASSSSITTTSTQKPMRKLKPFPSPVGTTFKDWLPVGEPLTTANTKLDIVKTTTKTPSKKHTPPKVNNIYSSKQQSENNPDDDDDEGPSSDSDELLKAWPTTQAPIYSTLPESDGNADLEVSAKPASRVPKSASEFKLARSPLQTAASTSRENNADYVTSSSISTNLYNQQQSTTSRQPYQLPYSPMEEEQQQSIRSQLNPTQPADGDLPIVDGAKDYLKDLNVSPIPLSSTSRLSPPLEHDEELHSSADGHQTSGQPPKAGRLDSHRLRSHMRWIYSSWYALSILGANICGALLTLYVLTFLLMRNCDGSLDRDNQGIRSMHLLAIIVVFFGSTLFIVYPTPGLCLLRTSWHNFALVMLFGSLLLQAMQTRGLGSLGLGGRPNRMNQFLTFIFMVAVQVAFELQRWKYESANYLNFVNQYFGNTQVAGTGGKGDKKLMMLNDAISSHKFNPLNSFNDQVTPIGIQISEHYQSLLQDYCLQQVDDFLESQIYLCLIVGLLVMFSASNRRQRRMTGPSTSNHHKLKSTLTSGKLVASQHEANLNLSPSHFQSFTSNSASSPGSTGNMFVVTIISALTYSMSIILQLYGQNTPNRDLISSITMVLIAFTALIGIFLPILLQIHCYDGLLTTTTTTTTSTSDHHHLSPGSLTRPVMVQSKLQSDTINSTSSSPNANHAFTMFPEFAPTGLRRPASISGDSSSGAGSRRTFADTKESRRNMGAALANLGPSADSLRSMGYYTTERKTTDKSIVMDPSALNLKLNLSAIDEPCSSLVDNDYGATTNQNQHFHHHHQHQITKSSSREQAKGEKRLIMLDVDPCCPRHGIGAWTKIDHDHGSSSKGCISCKSSHCKN